MKKILEIFFLLILSSCVSRLEKHGYMFDQSDHQLVQEGITSKEKLSQLMGSPTLVANFDDDEVWIYYSEDVDRFLFFRPAIKNRKILALRFDESDIINELRNIDLNDGIKTLKFASNYTPVNDHERGVFKSFFSNVGQVKPQ